MHANFTFLLPEVHGTELLLPYRAVAADGSEHSFTERISLSKPLDGLPAAPVAATLRLLSLAAGLSYYKAFVPATIITEFELQPFEAEFLRQLVRGGLGEFAFVNQLPAALTPEILDTTTAALATSGAAAPDAASITASTTAAYTTAGPAAATAAAPGASAAEVTAALAAIGGGKDSIVSLLALRRAGVTVTGFAINPKPPMVRTAEVAGVPLLTVRRELDSHLFELNRLGYPNGHVPVTAINSLLAILTAWAHDIPAVVFSNEAGASYGNVHWEGFDINHQWSKSSAFEALLRRSLPAEAPNYFSLLRPLNEIRIARNFAQHTQFHGVFTSCNRAFTRAAAADASWCGQCPKCQFIFLMLAPFLEPDALTAIFDGKNLFEDQTLIPGFLDLMGAAARQKPFECVGEPQECRVALTLAAENPAWRNTALFADPQFAAFEASPSEIAEVFELAAEQHFIPANLMETVREI